MSQTRWTAMNPGSGEFVDHQVAVKSGVCEQVERQWEELALGTLE